MGEQSFGVILVDPLHVVRAGLARLISDHPNLELRAEAASAEEALTQVARLRSKKNLVVMVGMSLGGEKDAFWLIRRIREIHPTFRILASGANADQTTVARALFVGADGFADQCTEPEEFIGGIVSCAAGDMVVTGALRGKLALIAEGIESQRAGSDLLTERQLEILEIASQGFTAREAAERLGLAERTVTTHLHRIYAKLGVSSRVAAINAARQRGLLKPALRVVS
jgi:DNA-binding NarL/FixJ family response regulator